MWHDHTWKDTSRAWKSWKGVKQNWVLNKRILVVSRNYEKGVKQNWVSNKRSTFFLVILFSNNCFFLFFVTSARDSLSPHYEKIHILRKLILFKLRRFQFEKIRDVCLKCDYIHLLKSTKGRGRVRASEVANLWRHPKIKPYNQVHPFKVLKND